MHDPHNDVDPPEPYPDDWYDAEEVDAQRRHQEEEQQAEQLAALCVICKTKPVDPEDVQKGFNVCPTCAEENRKYHAMLWDLVHEDPSGEMFGWAVL